MAPTSFHDFSQYWTNTVYQVKVEGLWSQFLGINPKP